MHVSVKSYWNCLSEDMLKKMYLVFIYMNDLQYSVDQPSGFFCWQWSSKVPINLQQKDFVNLGKKSWCPVYSRPLGSIQYLLGYAFKLDVGQIDLLKKLIKECKERNIWYPKKFLEKLQIHFFNSSMISCKKQVTEWVRYPMT